MSSLIAALSAWVLVAWSRIYVKAFRDTYPFPGFERTYEAIFAAFGAIVGFTVSSLIYRQALELWNHLISDIRKIPARDKLAVVMGIFIGLGMTALVGPLLARIPNYGWQLVVLTGFVSIYLGVAITLSMKEELHFFFPGAAQPLSDNPSRSLQPKLLDTSVIIDGRIADIARAGFVEGTILVPRFVLEELHLIADSSDTLKRNCNAGGWTSERDAGERSCGWRSTTVSRPAQRPAGGRRLVQLRRNWGGGGLLTSTEQGGGSGVQVLNVTSWRTR
jgi:hypothetical protein